MVHNWEDLDYQKASIGTSGALFYLLFILAIIFAAVGVIGDAANAKLGLYASSWLLLAIVVSLLSISFGICWALEWYLKTAA